MRPSLVYTALLSTAGGIVAHGIYFLAHNAYAFDDRQNLWLAVALFLPYIPGALLAGPVGRRWSPRAALQAVNALMILTGVVLALRPPPLGLWIAAPLYNGAAGLAWPLVEAYVAGGRAGPALHRAIGQFNLTWSLALAPALWVVALTDGDVTASFGALTAMHLLGAVAIRALPAAPAPADHHGDTAVPPSYPTLLRSARVLLPISYVLLDALSPLLPGVWARAGVAPSLAPLLSSTWMLARFVLFAALVRWAGWRGRPAALVFGAVAMLVGFAAALGGGAIPLVLAGLVAFGVGQGTLYYQALYYGMAVGKGEVDSGGAHEAVIGLGYLGGPLLALLGIAVGVPPIHAVGAVATVGALGAAVPWLRPRPSTAT
jgi:hypothetical protein